MKKILITIFFLTASTLIYSQSMNSNHNKIRIVDSTMGLGITPTSRLHVFGNGTTSNLFNLVNDKDATKDSSIIVRANGRMILGDSSIYLGGIINSISDSRLTIIGGTPLRLLNNNSIGYTSLKWSAMTDEDTIADYAQIMGGVMRNTYGNVQGSLYFQTATGGLSTKMFIDSSGYVGINTVAPKYRLDIGEGGTDATVDEIVRINSSNTTSSMPKILLSRADTTRTTIALARKSDELVFNSVKNDLIIKTETNNIFICANKDSIYDMKIDTNGWVSLGHPMMYRSGVYDYEMKDFLSDHEKFTLPTNYTWKGEIDVDSVGRTLFTAQIRCDADGSPYLEGVSWKKWSSITYVAVGSSDGYLNLSDDGSGMAITNELGYEIEIVFRLRD